jgi:hypothetical protein
MTSTWILFCLAALAVFCFGLWAHFTDDHPPKKR